MNEPGAQRTATEALLPAWSDTTAAVVDALAFVSALVFGVAALLESDAARVIVVSYVLFFLGWSLLRAIGAPACTMTAVGAVVAGAAITIITGFVTVTALDWALDPAVAVLVVIGTASSILHRIGGRP